jgi:hypothetical protein
MLPPRARIGAIKYRMLAIRAMRRGEAWCEGSEFFNGDRALEKAAKYFETLDLTDPEDRDELLHILAEVLFGRDVAGRPTGQKQWTEKKLARLGRLEIEIKQKYPKLKGDSKIAKIIVTEHKEFQSADVVRRRLPDARRLLRMLGN